MTLKRGDWAVCRCSYGECTFKGVVVGTRSDERVVVCGWMDNRSEWERDTLNLYAPYTPTEEEKIDLMKAILAGEVEI